MGKARVCYPGRSSCPRMTWSRQSTDTGKSLVCWCTGRRRRCPGSPRTHRYLTEQERIGDRKRTVWRITITHNGQQCKAEYGPVQETLLSFSLSLKFPQHCLDPCLHICACWLKEHDSAQSNTYEAVRSCCNNHHLSLYVQILMFASFLFKYAFPLNMRQTNYSNVPVFYIHCFLMCCYCIFLLLNLLTLKTNHEELQSSCMYNV